MALTYNRFKSTTVYGEFRNEDNTFGNTTLAASATFNGTATFNGDVTITPGKTFIVGSPLGIMTQIDDGFGLTTNNIAVDGAINLGGELHAVSNSTFYNDLQIIGNTSTSQIVNSGNITTTQLTATDVATTNINGTLYTPTSTYFNTATPAVTGLFQLGGSAGAPTCNFNGILSCTNSATLGNGNDLSRARRNFNVDNCLRVGYNDATDVAGNLSLAGNVVTSGGNKIETNGNIGCANITTTATMNCGTTFSVTGNATLSSETRIPLAGSLLFGSNASSRQVDAGRICYNTFDYFTDGNSGNGYMHIIGSGGGFPGRGIRMWDIVDIYQQLKVPEIILNGNNLATTMSNYLDFSGLTVYANTGTPLAVVKSGTPSAPVLTFTIPTTASSGSPPNFRIGNVVTSTSYSTIGATLTGTTDLSLSFTFPEFVTTNTTQTVTGTKTMGNLKLNASLQLTTPAVNISQTELSYLSGLTGNVQSQIGNCAPLANPTFTSDMTFSKSTAINILSSANKTVNLFTTNTTDVNPINIGNSSAGYVNINYLNIADTIFMPSVGDVKSSILGKANAAYPVFTGTVTLAAPTIVADVTSQAVNLFATSNGNINIGSTAATVKTTLISTTSLAVNQSTVSSGYIAEINGNLKVNGNISGNIAQGDITCNTLTATKDISTTSQTGNYYLTVASVVDPITFPGVINTNIATYSFQYVGADYDKQNIGSFQNGNTTTTPTTYSKFWKISDNAGNANGLGTTDTNDFNSATGKLGCRAGTYDIYIKLDCTYAYDGVAQLYIGSSIVRNLTITASAVNTYNFSNIVIPTGGSTIYIRPILNPIQVGQPNLASYISFNMDNTFMELTPSVVITTLPSVTATNLKCTKNFNLLPAGMISQYIGISDPEGWLICDGRYVSRFTYPRLFNILGYKFGSSGTDFRLPNYQGAFLRGAGSQSFPTSDGRTLTYYGGDMTLPHQPIQGSFYSEAEATPALNTNDIPNQLKSRIFTVAKNLAVKIDKFKEDLYNSLKSPTKFGNPFNTFSTSTTFDGLVENQPFNYPVNFIIKI